MRSNLLYLSTIFLITISAFSPSYATNSESEGKVYLEGKNWQLDGQGTTYGGPQKNTLCVAEKFKFTTSKKVHMQCPKKAKEMYWRLDQTGSDLIFVLFDIDSDYEHRYIISFSDTKPRLFKIVETKNGKVDELSYRFYKEID